MSLILAFADWKINIDIRLAMFGILRGEKLTCVNEILAAFWLTHTRRPKRVNWHNVRWLLRWNCFPEDRLEIRSSSLEQRDGNNATTKPYITISLFTSQWCYCHVTLRLALTFVDFFYLTQNWNAQKVFRLLHLIYSCFLIICHTET